MPVFYQTGGGATTVEVINRRVEYEYDGMMRLTDATYYDHGNLAEPVRTYAYTYDIMGNRSNMTMLEGNQAISNTYTYNEASQLIESDLNGRELAYDYDLNGNRIRVSENDVSVVEYEYDMLDRLTGYTRYNQGIPDIQFEYGYNAYGNRLSQTQLDPLTGAEVFSTEYLLDMNTGLTQILGEFGQNSETYYLLGWDVIGEATDGEWSYFGYDGLGSVRQITDGTGAVKYSANYDPYGMLLESRGDGSALGFAGEYSDATGLIYLRARYMDPDTGTFLSRDPVWGLAGGGSIRFNPYIYAGANPTNYLDPSGRFFQAMLAGAVIGAVVAAGVELYNQYQTNPNCIDWGKVLWAAGKGAIVGAVAGAVGSWATGLAAKAFGAMGLSATSSIAFKIVAGATATAFGGVVGGQAARATANILNGDPITKNLFRPEDIATDAVLAIAFHTLYAGAKGAYSGEGAVNGIRNSFMSTALPNAGWAAQMSPEDAAMYGAWGNAGSVASGAPIPRPNFYVTPDGETIPSRGYRYISDDVPYLDKFAETGLIPENSDPRGTYISFNEYSDSSTARSSLQLPSSNNANIRVEFDTLQIIDDIRIPNGGYGNPSYPPEAITSTFPNLGTGGGTQAVTNSRIIVDRIINLATGEILYGR